VYKRRWRTASEDVWNESYVVDNLFKEMYLRGEDVSHVLGAYDVSPEEHIKVQAVIQSFVDSALSKTCNLAESYKVTGNTIDTLTQYASEIKGFTFYKAGSRGNEPLTVVDWKSIDLDKLINSGVYEERSDGVDSCKNGVCEL